jgi:NitT/TauT family transport system permease protein
VTGRLLRAALGAAPIVALLLAWELATRDGQISPALLPPPAKVFARVVQQAVDPLFLGHLATTLFRLFAGLGIAAVAGVALALAAVELRWVGAIVRPVVRVLAPVPKVALYPAFILTLGFDHASKIALVVADALFPILLATHAGLVAVEPKLIWSARAAGASRLAVAITVALPSALPSILTGLRIGLIISCIVVFLAEMITSTDGLGHLLMRAARVFQTDLMFVPLIAISALGLSLNLGLGALRARLLRGFD